MRDRVERARTEFGNRLCARQAEIEQATLTRIYAIADPGEASDPAYAEGLRAAVAAALEYGLTGIKARDEERAPPVPGLLLTQARLAARNGISLDTVLRRYFAGYALLGDFLIEEAGRGDITSAELKRLVRNQATIFDRLLATVSVEYGREVESRPGSAEERRAERVKRLLDGELLDTSELAYRFDAHHIGLVAEGAAAPETLRALADSLDFRLLLVSPGEQTAWAWLGGRLPPDPVELKSRLSGARLGLSSFALGEPGKGLAGWRLTHRQAAAALPIARREPKRFARYADVALLASIVQDDLLATSLKQLYLAPLEQERDGGQAFRETLRAYFSADRNISSAAAALGVNRNTVTSRLRAIEERLGCSISANPAEIEAALRLEGSSVDTRSSSRRPAG